MESMKNDFYYRKALHNLFFLLMESITNDSTVKKNH